VAVVWDRNGDPVALLDVGSSSYFHQVSPEELAAALLSVFCGPNCQPDVFPGFPHVVEVPLVLLVDIG
jgi:hypothetical protein